MLNWEERWASECAEWQAIADAMISGRRTPVTAFEVSQEQRRRMRARGESPMRFTPLGPLELCPNYN